MAIIQLGIDPVDNQVYVETKLGKWLNIPAWVLCELTEEDGILGLIYRSGLHKMVKFQPHEYEALSNLRDDARAIRRYIERDENYMAALSFSPLMQQLVDLEVYLMQRHGWMKRDDVLDRICEMMEERGVDINNRQVDGYLEEAGHIMRAALHEEETRSRERVIRRITKVLKRDAA